MLYTDFCHWERLYQIYGNFSRAFEIVNQLPICHLLYLVPWMKSKTFSFNNVNWVGFFLFVRCLYNKQNYTWLLGDMEFSSCVQLDVSQVCCAHSWEIKLNTWGEITACPCIISCFLLLSNKLLFNIRYNVVHTNLLVGLMHRNLN